MADRPLAVAHVLGRLSRTGGIQTAIRRLAAHLDPEAVDLHVVTARPRLAEDALHEVSATVYGMGHTAVRHSAWTRLRMAFRVARQVRRLRPDVIHLHSGAAFLGVGALLTNPRTPSVIEVHDVPGSGRRSRATDWAEGFLARRFRMTVVSHSLDVEQAVQRRWRVLGKRCVRFPLSVDTEVFQPTGSRVARQSWRAAHGIGPDAVVLATVGRFAPVKRLPLALQALARIRAAGIDAVLVLVGGPPSGHGLDDVAADRGVTDAVRFLGTVPDAAQLAEILQAVDIACATSEYESFGLTFVEAMAAGLPVVTTAAGGPTEIIQDGTTGFRVGVHDLDGFVERVVALAQDPALRQRMGAAGRARAVARYDAREAAAAFTSLYRELTHAQ